MAMPVKPLISIKEVEFAFTKNRPVFRSFNLVLDSSENPVFILGPSGCGKTTLLRLISGLLKPASGTVEICATQISFVFQEPRLLPWKTILENVTLPLVQSMPKKEALERGQHFLSLVSLEDKARSLPGELSGGQQQRVNLARAFAFPSQLLLMDEPFQSLDLSLRIRLMDTTLSLLKTAPRLVVAVSHDPQEAVYMGRRIIVLGESPAGIIHTEVPDLSPEERRYGSSAQGTFEIRFLELAESR